MRTIDDEDEDEDEDKGEMAAEGVVVQVGGEVLDTAEANGRAGTVREVPDAISYHGCLFGR